MWQQTDKLLYYYHGKLTNNKIAAFDLDYTLIKTKSGKKFPIDHTDWVLWDDSIPYKLAILVSKGFQIVIFTNQSKLKKKENIPNYKKKIEQIHTVLPFNIQFYISIGSGFYRKPLTGMWDKMLEINHIQFINALSFYCGDAAGRIIGWTKGGGKDFACTDRMFAHNIGILFHTPEYVFLDMIESKGWKCHVNDLLPYKKKKEIYHLERNEPELIICVGYPGCGKSTFCRVNFPNYKIVNQDILKTKNKCLKVCKQYLEQGCSVVIDNTNPDSNIRKLYLDIAKKYKIDSKCLLFTCNQEISIHMNHFRCQISKGETGIIPIVVYRIYNKKYQKPLLNEGFSKIIKIPFIIDTHMWSIPELHYLYTP